MKYLLLALAMIPMFFGTALADNHDMNKLTVGDTIPDNIALKDQYGDEKDLGSLIGEAGAILVFYRSADWCPYCKAQLIDLRNNRQQFEEENFSLIGISYDNLETLAKFEASHDPGFTLLSDPDSAAIKAFGVFDETQREGGFSYGIPHPTIFVLDAKTEIAAVLAEESYKERPQIESIMDAVYALKGKSE